MENEKMGSNLLPIFVLFGDINFLAHQVYRADVNIIIKAYQIGIRADGDFALNAGVAAVTGRGLRCHTHGTPEGHTCLLVNSTYQPVAGGNTAQKTVL